MAFIPLYDDSGKRDKARRYVNEKNPSDIISRRKFDALSGALAKRPSSGTRFNPLSKVKRSAEQIKNAVKNPFEKAIKLIKKDYPLASAAKESGVSQKRLKEYMKAEGIKTGKGKVLRQTSKGERYVSQTVITEDNRTRSWYTYSNGSVVGARLDSHNASINARYLNDVSRFLKGDKQALDKWKGVTITTVDGQIIPLETDMKMLKRAKGQPHPNPYRIE